MIKIDYEGAWKELKENMSLSSLSSHMDIIEKRHTHDFIDIRKRGDKEIADYCLKKHAEIYLELVSLKKKLKESDDRPIKPERMDHMEIGAALGKPRTFNKKEYEERMDRWFEKLSTLQKADIADGFWGELSYEEKKEEYEAE